MKSFARITSLAAAIVATCVTVGPVGAQQLTAAEAARIRRGPAHLSKGDEALIRQARERAKDPSYRGLTEDDIRGAAYLVDHPEVLRRLNGGH